MSSSIEALIDRQVQAYNDQDLDRFIACYHPEAAFIRWPNEVAFSGHAQLRQRYAALFESAPNLRVRIDQRMVVGRFVTDLEILTGHPSGSGPDRRRPPVQVVYEVEGELIRRFWVISESS